MSVPGHGDRPFREHDDPPFQLMASSLNELKAFGMPLPAELVQFEHDLEAEFAAEKEDEERRARLVNVIATRAKK